MSVCSIAKTLPPNPDMIVNIDTEGSAGMQEAITPLYKVNELLERWPQVIPVFNRHRMGCVGCTMAPYETLGGAAEIYHLPLEVFLDEIQRAIQGDNPGA